MTYALVAGAAPSVGSDAFYRTLIEGASMVIAADAAGEWCMALGRVPDAVVGDFDSSEQDAPARLRTAGASVVEYPREKDATDLELAIERARALSPDPLVLSAAFTGRVDHTLAAIGLLALAGAGACVREPGWTAWACTPERDLSVDLAAGSLISVLAIGEANGVTLTGTQWPLSGALLPALSGRGVSNRAIGGPVEVSVGVGKLVVIVQDDADCGLY